MSKFLAGLVVLITVALVTFTGVFYLKSSNVKTKQVNEFSDIDEVYVGKTCIKKEFSSYLGFCHQ
jgi:hypothetical protein